MFAAPTWLKAARSLRPAHAVSALPRGSDLLLLNPRDLRRAAKVAIPRLTAYAPCLLHAALRAARDAATPVGLVKPGALQGEGPLPQHFAALAFKAAAEVHLDIPFFLASAPLPLQAGDSTGDRLAAEIQRYLDAGFTEIAVTMEEAVDPGAAAKPLLRALEVARERDVSVALTAGSDARLLPYFAELKRAGYVPDLIKLDEAPGPGMIERLAAAVVPAGVELGGDAPSSASLQGIDLSAPLRGLVEALAPAAAPPHFRELEALSAQAAERLEALAFADLSEAFRRRGLRSAARRALSAIAAAPGD